MVITDDNKFIFTESFTYLINSNLSIYDNILKKEKDTYKLNMGDQKLPLNDVIMSVLSRKNMLPNNAFWNDLQVLGGVIWTMAGILSPFIIWYNYKKL